MTDNEIYNNGYWLHCLPMARHNDFGYEILKKLKKSWRSELNQFGFDTPEEARTAGLIELKFIMGE